MSGRSAEQVEQTNTVAEGIVETIVETCHEEQALGGKEAASDLMEFILRDLASTIVYSALRSSDVVPNLSTDEKIRMIASNLLEARHLIEEAISEGFTAAYREFYGIDTEHMTEVRLIDDGSLDSGQAY